MKHLVPHDLGIEDAKQSANKAWKSFCRNYPQYEPTLRWLDDSSASVQLVANGIVVKAHVFVRAKAIEFDIKVPLLLWPFKAKIVSLLDAEMRTWIVRCTVNSDMK
ncbi:MAG: hypothetical protein GKR94_11760 [Gammaproteobacteria bacterium]|nr:hypothetical protein [Gammaproteobacteria bacterium]